MHQPSLHQGVITLPRIDRRVLRTPAERFESVRKIMRVVCDPILHKNHRANATERPTIRVKAGLQSASTQHPQQLLPLLGGEARRAPRDAMLVQTAKVALVSPQLLSPSADSCAADPHLARNGRLREVASLPQPTSFQATFFKLRTGKLSWFPSHDSLV
jgi:hypothetical protein